MGTIHVNIDAHRENVRALMVAAGLQEEVATKRLEATTVITVSPGDAAAEALAGEITSLLSRTLTMAPAPPVPAVPISVEVILGAATPMTSAQPVFVSMRADRVEISR